MSWTTIFAVRLLLLIALLAVWDVLPRLHIVNPALLPPFGDILAVLAKLLARPQVHHAIGVTAAELVAAFVVAIPLGATLGLLATENAYFGSVFKPILFYVFSIPKSIFLPLFILVLGLGFHQKVAYAVFQMIFIVIISTIAAVESVKPDHVLVARAYGATRAQILRRVYLPSMTPVLLETLRIAIMFDFTGVMIAEMYASREGLGHMIAGWGENFMLPELFAGVLLLALTAIILNEAIRFLEKRWTVWHA